MKRRMPARRIIGVALLLAYLALAVVIGTAYGGAGLAILLFFYVLPLAWLAFLSGWGWTARLAGHWNFRRLDRGR
jgi:hypothetical protein